MALIISQLDTPFECSGSDSVEYTGCNNRIEHPAEFHSWVGYRFFGSSTACSFWWKWWGFQHTDGICRCHNGGSYHGRDTDNRGIHVHDRSHRFRNLEWTSASVSGDIGFFQSVSCEPSGDKREFFRIYLRQKFGIFLHTP